MGRGKNISRLSRTCHKIVERLYWRLGGWGGADEKHDQRSCTWFLEKYGGIPLYDIYIEKRYTFDDKDILFVNKHEYDLIGYPEHPYGTSTYHEYFLVHYDFFDRIL